MQQILPEKSPSHHSLYNVLGDQREDLGDWREDLGDQREELGDQREDLSEDKPWFCKEKVRAKAHSSPQGLELKGP